MSQISRLRNAEIANGNLINADDIAAELNQLVSANNSLDTAVTTLESGNITVSGTKTFTGNNTHSGNNNHSGNNTFSGANSHTGQENFARTADPGTPVDGDFWYNATSDVFKAQVNGKLFIFANAQAIAGILSKSANYTPVAGDGGYLIKCSATLTLALSAAATLGANWFCYVENIGSGVVTIDPNGAETVDGYTSINIGPGNGCLLFCDGAEFYAFGKSPEAIVLQDQKAAGTEGGTSVGATWNTRVLNTEVIDTANNCTLSANQFTLLPGTYDITACAPAIGDNGHKIRLRNITDSTTTLIGSSCRSTSATTVQGHSFLRGRFTISTAKTFELQHYFNSGLSTTGLGSIGGNAANGELEIYATVSLLRVG